MPAELTALVLTAVLAAGAPPGDTAPSAPDTELLEFLGSFGTADGKWLDPLSLDDRDAQAESRKTRDTRRAGDAAREEKQP